MIWDKLKYPACVALLAIGLIGFGLGQWASATDNKPGKNPDKNPVAAVNGKDQGPAAVVAVDNDSAKPEAAKPKAGGAAPRPSSDYLPASSSRKSKRSLTVVAA